MDRKFADLVLDKLQERYGSNLHTQLRHRNNTELFVAVLLSPQCNDNQVNKTTESLFRKYKTFYDYSHADLKTLRSYLNGLNYYKTKAKYLKETAGQILKYYDGKIPKSISELTRLQGVGRKVANVILNEAYGINEGIAVDTHVNVTARRLWLIRSKKPEIIEQRLMKIFDKEDWGKVSNLLIELGRDTCKARKKECYRCVLNKICPSSNAK